MSPQDSNVLYTIIRSCDCESCKDYLEDLKGHCNLGEVNLDFLGQCSAYQRKDRFDQEREREDKRRHPQTEDILLKVKEGSP